jgi:hypothetical protein
MHRWIAAVLTAMRRKATIALRAVPTNPSLFPSAQSVSSVQIRVKNSAELA